jgi:hypothetical protein
MTFIAMRNVALVHGGFVDGSGWEGVYKALKKDRCAVTIVQIPPAAQRLMSKRAGSTIVEVNRSHSIFISQPQAVASLIEKGRQRRRVDYGTVRPATVDGRL